MVQSRVLLLALSIGLSGLLLQPGCISLSSKKLKKVSREPRAQLPGAPGISVRGWWFQENSFRQHRADWLSNVMSGVLRRSGLFSSVTPEMGTHPYHLKVAVRIKPWRPGLSIFTGVLFVLSGSLIPFYGRTLVDMEATLYRKGQVVRTYRVRDTITEVAQLVLLFAALVHTGGRARFHTVRNMAWYVVDGLNRDLRGLVR